MIRETLLGNALLLRTPAGPLLRDKASVAAQQQRIALGVEFDGVHVARIVAAAEEQRASLGRDDGILHQPPVAERVVEDQHPVGPGADAADRGREVVLRREPRTADAVVGNLLLQRGDKSHKLGALSDFGPQRRERLRGGDVWGTTHGKSF